MRAQKPAEPWDTEKAARLAADALRYLGRNAPEVLENTSILELHEEAAHQAAMRGDELTAGRVEAKFSAFGEERRERNRLIRCRLPHTNRRGRAGGPAAVGGGVNLSPQGAVVVSVALVAVIGNAYFYRMGVRDDNRGLYLSAAGAFLNFSLVAIAFFGRGL